MHILQYTIVFVIDSDMCALASADIAEKIMSFADVSETTDYEGGQGTIWKDVPQKLVRLNLIVSNYLSCAHMDRKYNLLSAREAAPALHR
jgi:hypothetical protein